MPWCIHERRTNPHERGAHEPVRYGCDRLRAGAPKQGDGVWCAIEAGCNGVEAAIILIAGMVAFPASWRLKLIGIAIGILAVQGVNLSHHQPVLLGQMEHAGL